MSFIIVEEFEKQIANFFGSPYAVAVDCCTHGLEVCLRYTKEEIIRVPFRTYISIPFLASKLSIKLEWKDENWDDYYYISERIIDAAVLWKKDSYIKNTFMCISFQFRKHLNLGRGGMILCPDKTSYNKLKKMIYDGRDPNIPWRDQDIDSVGYHYYMTPETASRGIEKLPDAIKRDPKKWKINEWPDLRKMKVFNNM
tara:strand:- start:12805 stop:13398 length:594 start_codon:yes stop_codon:yes gene_type:complete